MLIQKMNEFSLLHLSLHLSAVSGLTFFLHPSEPLLPFSQACTCFSDPSSAHLSPSLTPSHLLSLLVLSIACDSSSVKPPSSCNTSFFIRLYLVSPLIFLLKVLPISRHFFFCLSSLFSSLSPLFCYLAQAASLPILRFECCPRKKPGHNLF